MTTEQAQKDFDKLIAENGFTIAGYTSDTNSPICQKVWTNAVQVAWYSEQDSTLEIRIRLSFGYPLVSVKRNGKLESNLIRDYSSPKRAMNAIREIVRCAGFEW